MTKAPKKQELLNEQPQAPIEEVELEAKPAEAAEPKVFNQLMVFTSSVCGPCKQMKPVLEKLSADYSFAPEYIAFDADATAGLFTEFGVRNVPALVHVRVTDDGNHVTKDVLDRKTGFEGEAKLKFILEQWGYIKA